LLAAPHRARAATLEREGALRRALDEVHVALTIDPDDGAAREARGRLEARIEGAVAEHVGAAREALTRGAHIEARRRLLSALALDPENRTAFAILQTEAREMPFVTHTVRAGDTLAALAQRYYGDRARSEVIWETNRLGPNPRLAAGTTLKIPEIPGVPFIRVEPRRDTPPAAPPRPGAPPPPPRSEPAREEEPPEVNPLLADAREALERNEYTVALADVNRFLTGSPTNREGLDLKKVVLYRQGREQLDRKQYVDSYRTLVQLARLQPDYQDVGRLMQQARGRAIDNHYSAGIRLYREERLPEAIAEWRTVLELDPAHVNAKRNIEHAERLLKGLEQRRKR